MLFFASCVVVCNVHLSKIHSCLVLNVYLHYEISELTDALWAGSVQVQVHNRPMYMKVAELIV